MMIDSADAGNADTEDPVRRRRQLVATWTRRANRLGYFIFGLAVASFVVAFATDFSGPLVTVTAVSLVVGSILLAPAIVLGYAIKAAEKEDRGPGGPSAHS